MIGPQGLGVRKRLQLLMGGLILLAVFFVLALTVAALSVLVVAVSEPLPASDTIQRLVPLLQGHLPGRRAARRSHGLSGIDSKREIREILDSSPRCR